MRPSKTLVSVFAAALVTVGLTGLSPTPASATTFWACPSIGNVINGTANDDILIGTSGVDIIDGKGGNDIILGLDGMDVIKGGPGDDWLYGEGSGDCMWGDAGDDHLYGGSGNDAMWGENGWDYLDGSDGANLLDGGVDPDTCIGDDYYTSTFVSCDTAYKKY